MKLSLSSQGQSFENLSKRDTKHEIQQTLEEENEHGWGETQNRYFKNIV